MANKEDPKSKTDAYAALLRHLERFSDASLVLDQLQVSLNNQFLELLGEHREEYAAQQGVVTETEKAIESLARKNPQWFVKPKTLKTPFGEVSFRATRKLEVKNPEVTQLLIEQRIEAEKEEMRTADVENPTAPSESFLRQTVTLNLEALEKLDDQELKRLRINRVEDESFSVKPKTVDLGKAVKAAAEKESEVAA